MIFFFFFKQKTAYDMRISDWSSDVCSSDLHFTLAEYPAIMAFNVRGVCRQKLSGSNPASDQSSRSLSQSQPDPASEGLPFPLPPLQAWMREWLAPVRSSQKARQQLQ